MKYIGDTLNVVGQLFSLLKDMGLSPTMAFSVIHFMQVGLGCLPDNIKMCKGCKQLFDSTQEGCCLNGIYHWCDSCCPGSAGTV